MKGIIIAIGVAVLLACQSFAKEYSVLARVTVYWHGEGSGERASWNGTRLREGSCAVDPKRIPYGSKVVFPDVVCLAVDTGPDVVSRKAARSCGRQPVERKAIVIDRFFETKQKAIAWTKIHPHFMTVRILSPDSNERVGVGLSKEPGSSLTRIASDTTAGWEGTYSDFPSTLEHRLDCANMSPYSFLQYARRRT